MGYEIKFYSEDYLPKHVEIGESVYKYWKGGAQSSVFQLKKAYADIDPETKYYAFQGDRLVGFQTASILDMKESEPLTARLEFPFVEEGHEAAKDELFDFAVKTLKGKGVQLLRSRAGLDWGDTLKMAETRGYRHASTLTMAATVNTKDFDLAKLASHEDVLEFNYERDIDALGKAFVKAFNLDSVDEIEGLLNQMKTLRDDYFYVSHKIVKDGGEIVGRLLFYSRNEEKYALTGSVVVLGDNADEIEEKMLAAGIRDCLRDGIESFQLTFNAKRKDKLEKYEKLGLEFYDSVSYWERKI
ncbi:MAG: hypothetical protein HeimC2_31110 [Candidatus Heimdallarchaeota archaeon LC_2]|nr:MAG: hypothetical protein HeimC2_31110 [Candidatus Heimdallarchaeota archaeon LC_2]